MTRVSPFTTLAAFAMFAAASAAHAQNATPSPAPGTNNAGTAQSSGSNHERGVTTGSAAVGSGRAAPDPTTSSGSAIKAENNTIDRKLKGICRGC